MKIIHNVGLNVSEIAQKEFKLLGFDLSMGITSFKIEESDKRWPQVQHLSVKYNAIDTCITKFTEKEQDAANYLYMVANWHYGYPEPSDDFGYLEQTYDVTKGCLTCDIGLIQKAPFRFAKEPKWGRRNILQLNWIFDEFFVQPELWEKVFKPIGIQCRDVLHAKKDKKLDTVVQLIIPEDDVHVDVNGYPSKTCEVCGRVKTLPISRGYFPPLLNTPSAPIFKVRNCFGSGGSAYRQVIVSSLMFKAIQDYGVKGVEFEPCAE